MSNTTPFSPIAAKADFPKEEEAVLKQWEKTRAFVRSVEQFDRDDADRAYAFYDGPPFATGLPHYGHLVASTLKDIIPRYWTMRGKRVERRFGWDTHGLPIENLIEQELGLSGPTSIREYGVDKFNEACRAGVLKYTAEWEQVITRLGRWVDFENDYKTMDLPFMESVWWVFGELFKKGLVYQGARVMPYSWALSTALSNFEANLDYRDVEDPAVTLSMPIVDDPDQAMLLVWTTTPWTLPSNLGVAVGTDITYVRAKRDPEAKGDLGLTDPEQIFVVARALAERVLGKGVSILSELPGNELVGLHYTPLFDSFIDHPNAFVVMGSDHVTTDDGTGLVHMAPAYGEDDFAACEKVGIAPVDPVDEEGRFTDQVPQFAGRNIKEADKDIIRALKDKGRLVKHERIKHSYPFCWRTGTPLIYKLAPVWFIKVDGMQTRMQEQNDKIHWVPEAVGKKRFGNWLGDARDWAVSRSRFWGTPIPLYRCEACDDVICLSSAAELAERAKATIEDLHPHKIDHLKITCEKCGGQSTRIPEVFDCWFESGSMPYAQDHYPFENKERFEAGFPAEFIAEGLDQTRGWFYTLLVLSTVLFDKPAFKNVIVNGLVLARDEASDGKGAWKKMSKKDKNYEPAEVALDKYGADALRAYLINSPVVRAESLKFDPEGIRDVVRTVLIPLRNAWSFFVQYANIDGWSPKDTRPEMTARSELDRWLLSVLQSLITEVNTQMEGYYLYKVIPPLLNFIDDLTNWYIRRSRRRFWRSMDSQEGQADKMAAYATLYEVLETFSKLMAPVLPFLTESIYQNLVVETGVAQKARDGGLKDSVHLCDYPQANPALIDSQLELQMQTARDAVTLGRALREKYRLKTRQPLAKAIVVSHSAQARAAIVAHAELLKEELNVADVEVLSDDESLSEVSFKANFKTLGKRLGKRMKEAAGLIGQLDRTQWSVLQDGGTLSICDVDIGADDVQVTRSAKGDVVLENAGELTVALDTVLTGALVEEGLMREVLSRLQRLRKDTDLDVTDRVHINLSGDAALAGAVARYTDHLKAELLAISLVVAETPASDAVDLEIENVSAHASLRKAE